MNIQGSPEWLAERLGKLTASRMADVLATTKTGPSASRKNYLAQLVAERLTGLAQESYSNAAMQWGIENEPIARVEYEIALDTMVTQVGFVNHPTIPMCGASPDGLVVDSGLVEIKCPNTATHIQYSLAAEVPTKYRAQMTLQLLCTERLWCDFVSYDPRMPIEHQLFIARFTPTTECRTKVEDEATQFLAEVDNVIEQLQSRNP